MSRNSTCEDGEDRPGQFASPPCFMHELDPSYMGVPVDPQQTCDVARWRKCERERLIAARFAMPTDERLEHAARIAKDLDAFIAIAPETIISVYWPIRGEPDLRPWMTTLCKKGVRIALPAVAGAALPLLFREWLPGAQMERGAGNIPFPGGGAALLQPSLSLLSSDLTPPVTSSAMAEVSSIAPSLTSVRGRSQSVLGILLA